MAQTKKKKVGRPVSGRNTVTISFSVHKDFKEDVMETVRNRVKQLKKKQLAATAV